MNSKKRLLHISRNLPPLVGGMERLNWHLADELAHDFEIAVVGPLGAGQLAPASVASVTEAPLKPLRSFMLASTAAASKLALRWRPNVVLAGSGLMAPVAWLAGTLAGGRTAVYLHGLDIVVRHTVYRLAWLPIIRRIDVVFVNSYATRRLAVESGIAEAKITVVHPGVHLPSDEERLEAESQDFLRTFKLEGRRVMLSVGRLTERKGIRQFVEDVLPKIVREEPSAILVVIGAQATDALTGSVDTSENIMRIATEKGVEKNVRFVGRVDDMMLSSAYGAANVHVFPILDILGDPEGFGMVAIEAAAHGLPTVAYACGGVVDAVSDGVSGYLVPPARSDLFAAQVVTLLRGNAVSEDSTRRFAQDFSWKTFGQKARAALREC